MLRGLQGGISLVSFLKLIRPYHWIKNLFIFVPLLFGRKLFVTDSLKLAGYTFVVFSLAASTAYILNDILDREQDAKHPEKGQRPISKGEISILTAWVLAGFLFTLTMVLTAALVPKTLPVIGLYLILNLLYSGFLKRVVAIDLVVISSFYLLRVLAGALAVEVPVSGWLVLVTIFLTLFLVIGKRKAELNKDIPRQVLEKYSRPFLNNLLAVSAGLTLVSYGLYTVLEMRSGWAVYTVLFVVVGVFRYLWLAYNSDIAEYPERVIFRDSVIGLSFIFWSVTVFVLLYT